VNSYKPLLIAYILLVPVWAWTRGSAALDLVTHRPPQLMSGLSIFLSSANVPIPKFPWYYDEAAVKAFEAGGAPFGEFVPARESHYTHIPPQEPGLAIPLKVNALFGRPVSVTSLIVDQMAVDAVVFAILGLLCFRIGGIVGAVIGLGAYAFSSEIAFSSTFPYYYYWPIPFSILLVSILTLLYRASKRWVLLCVCAGLTVGMWCWFRGTATTLFLLTPVLVGLLLRSQRRAVAGIALTILGIILALLPSAVHAWFDGHSIFPRQQVWHDLFVGIGSQPNPYGIINRDEYAFNLAKSKYGVSFPSPEYEQAIKTEYLTILRSDPGLILRNFALNLLIGLTGATFRLFPIGVLQTLWFGALLGLMFVKGQHDNRMLLLGSIVAIWLWQCATLAAVKLPGNQYLWETIGPAVVAGASGFGIASQALMRKKRLVIVRQS